MTYSLSGSGTQALSSGTGALRIHVTTLPAISTQGNANPPNLYGIGLIRQGDGTSWWRAESIEAEHMLLPLLQGTTEIGYSLLHGATIDVDEVIETSPFYQPLPPASSPDLLLLDVVELGAANASIALSASTGTGYSHLRVLATLSNGSGSNSTVNVNARINADTTDLLIASCNGADSPNRYSMADILIMDFLKADRWKALSSVCRNDTGSSGNFQALYGANWQFTAVIATVTLRIASGTFKAGCRASLYAFR